MIDLKERLEQASAQAKEREETAKRMAERKLEKLKKNTNSILNKLEYELDTKRISSNVFNCDMLGHIFIEALEYKITLDDYLALNPYEKPFIEDSFFLHMKEKIQNEVFSEIKDLIELKHFNLHEINGTPCFSLSIDIQDTEAFFSSAKVKEIYPKWFDNLEKEYNLFIRASKTQDQLDIEDQEDIEKAKEEACGCVDEFISLILDQFDLGSYLEIRPSKGSSVKHHFIQDLGYRKLARNLKAKINMDSGKALESFISRLVYSTQDRLEVLCLRQDQENPFKITKEDENHLINVFYKT